MIKVEKLDKSKLKDFVCEDNPSFSGIVAGECAGSLWVDDIDNPSLALAYSFAVGGYCILGQPQKKDVYKQFYDFLRNEFFPTLKKKI